MSTFVTGLKSAEDESSLEEALSSVKKPIGVGDPDILLGTDHSGDAAVHIIYPVSAKLKPTTGRINALVKFSEAVHNRIRELRLDRLAYVRFVETKF